MKNYIVFIPTTGEGGFKTVKVRAVEAHVGAKELTFYAEQQGRKMVAAFLLEQIIGYIQEDHLAE